MRAVLGLLISGLMAVGASAEGMFETLQANCGKAFAGTVSRGADDDPWRAATLVMHVRDCSATEVRVPLAFNDDLSRIWVITRMEGGLRLKHDHRHADGSEDAVTWYGGMSMAPDGAAGDTEVNFPVDAASIALFEREGLNASVQNTWQMSVAGGMFNYRLTRPGGRDFMVSFDLTKPIAPPPPAWDKASEGAEH
ncbi:MAG: hypothetical protein JJ850_09565 [Kordiimonadaceae bacterium]|nr:hypothetical protein [Kordiimonadaceae bacterium]MBO6569378.1 hypothetical protein [Kordiimonadaceae bacterium]MBO6964853.1 hypothetical protein [Kordiimonadaceae bacterium]